MKTTRPLVSWAMLCVASLLVYACDYYEPPQLLIEEESTSETPTDTKNKISAVSDEDKITLYEVNGEDIIKIEDYKVEGELLDLQNDLAKHQEVWELVKKIIPPNYRSKMNEFLIYHGAASNTSGFVDPTINNLSKWQFAIAIDYAYRDGFNTDGEVALTIIHEFGHILTLNNEQITPGIIPNNCTNYYVSKGCAKNGSYINTFQELYWSDIWEEYENRDDTHTAKSQFYEKYSDRFVSEYAATNPREDIAEIFATFVVQDDASTGDSIVEQKIQMMYEASELNDLRDFIRQNSGAEFLPVGKKFSKIRCLKSL